MKETQNFLTVMFGGAPGGFGLSYIPLSDTKQFNTIYCDDLDEVVAQADKIGDKSQSVYLRMATLRQKPKDGRGLAADSWYLPAVWSDLDYGTIGHSDPNLPPDADSAESVIAASGLPEPSLIVNSGGGLYGYWLFDRPIEITDDNRSEISDLMTGWQRQLAAGSERLGWHYGTGIGDLARVLRLPGSVNRKEGLDRPCKVTKDDGPRYSYAELTTALEDAGLVVEPIAVDLPVTRFLSKKELKNPPTPAEVHKAEMLLRQRVEGIATGTLVKSDGTVAEGRNVGCNAALFLLYQFVMGGCLDREKVEEDIWWASLKAPGPDDWDRDEFDGVCASAWKGAAAEGPQRPVVDDDFTIQHEIFDATPILSHIRQAAHSRMVGSGALLCYTLGRVLAETPPDVVLPAVVGGRASLNLAFALVGKSGDGKSGCLEVSAELLGLDQNYMEIGLGSGEGLIESYLETVTAPDPNDPTKTVKVKELCSPPSRILDIDEIGRLGAVGKERHGSTMLPVIRSALTGGALKTANATFERKRSIERGAYRLVVFAGVQPELSDVLLNDVNAGTPQRFLWVSVIDKTLPDDIPDWPGTLDWDAAHIEFMTDREIQYPEHIKEEVRENRMQQVREGSDASKGHLLLTRLKVASALALLHRDTKITDEWWRISGLIMDWSWKEQGRCHEALAKAAERKNKSKGIAAGHAKVAEEEVLTDAKTKKVTRSLARIVERAGEEGISAATAKRTLWRDHRDYFEEALAAAVNAGLVVIEETEYKGQKGRRLRQGG